MKNTRREFLHTTALGTLGVGVMGATLAISPSAARDRAVPLRIFSPQEAETLEALGDVLLPGAAAAGLVHFVDHHCAVPSTESLLMLKYLNVAPPYGNFYCVGLRALIGWSIGSKGGEFSRLSRADQEDMVVQLEQGGPSSWPEGVPAFKFYTAVRADAVDVVYGTVEGFQRLGIGYMPHIPPAKPW